MRLQIEKGCVIIMAGYLGSLIKIKGLTVSQGDYILPLQLVEFKSYKATYSALDKDSNRNGDGNLVRTVLPHKVAHCSITVRSTHNEIIGNLMKAIQDRYIKPLEKKVRAIVWVQEENDYVEAEFYVPDIEFTIKRIEQDKRLVFYEPFTLEFIGY